VTEEEYNKNIVQIRNILRGKVGVVKDYFKEEMNQAATGMEFEKRSSSKTRLTCSIAFRPALWWSTLISVTWKFSQL